MATSIDLSGTIETITSLVPLIVVIMVLKMIIGMLSGLADEF